MRPLVVIAFLACLLTFALGGWFLFVVLSGAAVDARLLADASPWLLLVYPAYWVVAWTFGSLID